MSEKIEYKYYLQSFHVKRQSTDSNQSITNTCYLEVLWQNRQLSYTSSLAKDWKNIPATFYTVYLDLVC